MPVNPTARKHKSPPACGQRETYASMPSTLTAPAVLELPYPNKSQKTYHHQSRSITHFHLFSAQRRIAINNTCPKHTSCPGILVFHSSPPCTLLKAPSGRDKQCPFSLLCREPTPCGTFPKIDVLRRNAAADGSALTASTLKAAPS